MTCALGKPKEEQASGGGWSDHWALVLQYSTILAGMMNTHCMI